MLIDSPHRITTGSAATGKQRQKQGMGGEDEEEGHADDGIEHVQGQEEDLIDSYNNSGEPAITKTTARPIFPSSFNNQPRDNGPSFRYPLAMNSVLYATRSTTKLLHNIGIFFCLGWGFINVQLGATAVFTLGIYFYLGVYFSILCILRFLFVLGLFTFVFLCKLENLEHILSVIDTEKIHRNLRRLMSWARDIARLYTSVPRRSWISLKFESPR